MFHNSIQLILFTISSLYIRLYSLAMSKYLYLMDEESLLYVQFTTL